MAAIFDLITKSKIFFKKNLNVPHAPNIEPLLLHLWPLNTPIGEKMGITMVVVEWYVAYNLPN